VIYPSQKVVHHTSGGSSKAVWLEVVR